MVALNQKLMTQYLDLEKYPTQPLLLTEGQPYLDVPVTRRIVVKAKEINKLLFGLCDFVDEVVVGYRRDIRRELRA